ncbi:MAG: hypothetical protein WCG42_08470, partial [Parachlamydiaceae bacterium]
VLTDSSYENFQFPGCDNHVIRPDIDEDRKRLEQFRKKQIDNVFEIDHVFCSSMEEQRSELEQILKAESLSLKGTAEPLVAESLPILCPSIFEKEGNI